ncbi:hypothetical protein HRI_004792900 [Hibiscus trionum]|uniref:Uncharacterized protein n=1 Tax=Hibiscus trionum TaxID=183268 RepID=A0A9W7JDN3_HIBTR|nr:hypothetical protein HRI_004792900 [Hibiscus trionum]
MGAVSGIFAVFLLLGLLKSDAGLVVEAFPGSSTFVMQAERGKNHPSPPSPTTHSPVRQHPMPPSPAPPSS